VDTPDHGDDYRPAAQFNTASLYQHCEEDSSRRGATAERGEIGFSDTRSGRNEEFNFGKVRHDNLDKDRQISRLVVEAGFADRAIVVVASVIMVMKGHHESRKHYETDAEKRETLDHGFVK